MSKEQTNPYLTNFWSTYVTIPDIQAQETIHDINKLRKILKSACILS